MLLAVSYASCYVYSPAGTDVICERSRRLRTLLKSADAGFMHKYALRVRQQAKDLPQLADFFGETTLLVPVPGNAAHSPGGIWPAELLAVALVNEGLGRVAWTGLHRVRTVRKSATAAPGSRPTVDLHYRSFSFERPEELPKSIVLIDDVITKGRTLFAAANRIHEALPCIQIRAFALLRTMGLVSGVQRLLDPCQGEIRWESGDARRIP